MLSRLNPRRQEGILSLKSSAGSSELAETVLEREQVGCKCDCCSAQSQQIALGKWKAALSAGERRYKEEFGCLKRADPPP